MLLTQDATLRVSIICPFSGLFPDTLSRKNMHRETCMSRQDSVVMAKHRCSMMFTKTKLIHWDPQASERDKILRSLYSGGIWLCSCLMSQSRFSFRSTTYLIPSYKALDYLAETGVDTLVDSEGPKIYGGDPPPTWQILTTLGPMFQTESANPCGGDILSGGREFLPTPPGVENGRVGSQHSAPPPTHLSVKLPAEHQTSMRSQIVGFNSSEH